jgi:hypothetical protein
MKTLLGDAEPEKFAVPDPLSLNQLNLGTPIIYGFSSSPTTPKTTSFTVGIADIQGGLIYTSTPGAITITLTPQSFWNTYFNNIPSKLLQFKICQLGTVHQLNIVAPGSETITDNRKNNSQRFVNIHMVYISPSFPVEYAIF